MAVFWDAHRIIFIVYLHKRKTINALNYANLTLHTKANLLKFKLPDILHLLQFFLSHHFESYKNARTYVVIKSIVLRLLPRHQLVSNQLLSRTLSPYRRRGIMNQVRNKRVSARSAGRPRDTINTDETRLILGIATRKRRNQPRFLLILKSLI